MGYAQLIDFANSTLGTNWNPYPLQPAVSPNPVQSPGITPATPPLLLGSEGLTPVAVPLAAPADKCGCGGKCGGSGAGAGVAPAVLPSQAVQPRALARGTVKVIPDDAMENTIRALRKTTRWIQTGVRAR